VTPKWWLRAVFAPMLLTGVLASCHDARGPTGTSVPAVTVGSAGCTIAGTARDDVLRGTPGDDVICGGEGHDVLLGRGGSDVLLGGRGSDALFGGAGADELVAGPDIDLLQGGPGRDVLRGGTGKDRCDAGSRDRATSCAGPSGDPVVAAAGDIVCPPGGSSGSSSCQQVATSDLLVGGDAWRVLTTGDNQYDDGELSAFREAYAASWGRAKAITRPSPGNHDYHVADARGYFAYFGPLAGKRGEGYYSFDVGDWHIIALNSNCEEIGGCEEGSPQERWLRDDLAAHPATCTLAYWHHPRFSSGSHGNSSRSAAFWQALYEAGADVVLNGHDHTYERFSPQDPEQMSDPNGIREFVVGTGGKSHYTFGAPEPNSEVRSSGTFGILELTLRAGGYDWRFVPAAGGSFEDSGSGTCS
jgi:acid phosphatase type 7